MGSSGKKKTTMAKLAREHRLRERRLNKQAKKDTRKREASERPVAPEAPSPGAVEGSGVAPGHRAPLDDHADELETSS